jgi:hypothetical protein
MYIYISLNKNTEKTRKRKFEDNLADLWDNSLLLFLFWIEFQKVN